jgi:hypothetical protein
MRLFQALIFDEYLEGPSSANTSNGWSLLLGRAESLKFTCIADRVSSTPPVVTIKLRGRTSDSSRATATDFLKTVFSGSVQAGPNPLLSFGPADATYPPSRHVSLSVAVNSGGNAHLKIWVCGRGPQLLEAIPPAAPSFAAQYAAARMLADEDRTSLKKELLRPGASLFYPPELFDASLKWER